jgi:hypothetical protein
MPWSSGWSQPWRFPRRPSIPCDALASLLQRRQCIAAGARERSKVGFDLSSLIGLEVGGPTDCRRVQPCEALIGISAIRRSAQQYGVGRFRRVWEEGARRFRQSFQSVPCARRAHFVLSIAGRLCATPKQRLPRSVAPASHRYRPHVDGRPSPQCYALFPGRNPAPAPRAQEHLSTRHALPETYAPNSAASTSRLP